jgi:hypothetical protein
MGAEHTVLRHTRVEQKRQRVGDETIAPHHDQRGERMRPNEIVLEVEAVFAMKGWKIHAFF